MRIAKEIHKSLQRQLDRIHLNLQKDPKDGGLVNKLLKNADLAIYQAKEKGGNQYQFYTSHLNKLVSHKVEFLKNNNAMKFKDIYLENLYPQNKLNNIYSILKIQKLDNWL